MFRVAASIVTLIAALVMSNEAWACIIVASPSPAIISDHFAGETNRLVTFHLMSASAPMRLAAEKSTALHYGGNQGANRGGANFLYNISRSAWPSKSLVDRDVLTAALPSSSRIGPATVPEPGSMLLLGAGLLGVAVMGRRFSRRC